MSPARFPLPAPWRETPPAIVRRTAVLRQAPRAGRAAARRRLPRISGGPGGSRRNHDCPCRHSIAAAGAKLISYCENRRRRLAMDAVTPTRQQSADQHSYLVRPQDMEWQKTRFPGCEAKTLLFDRATGLVTALMRFAPGAVLPDHEHVNIEQTYVLEGHLVDKEGPAKGIEAKAGEFVWREAGSRHVAWCPQGGLMIAIFQVPNKFFEADGRVVDAAGHDWDETWGHTGKAAAEKD